MENYQLYLPKNGRVYLFLISYYLFQYANYGYGYGFSGEDYSVGAYNPRYHYLAAQNAGFDLQTQDGLPKTM